MRQPNIAIRTHASGLTLVELLVAVVMGLVLLAGVGTVFVANKQTYRLQEALARNQENGRFALTLLARDLRSAGYSGCGSMTPVEVGNTVCDFDKYKLRYGNPVEGFDASGTGWVPGLLSDSELGLGGSSPRPLAGSDIITIRTVQGCDNTVEKHPSESSSGGKIPGSAPLQMSSTSCVKQGDIVMVTDCSEYALFYVTGFNSNNILHTIAEGNCGNNGRDAKELGRGWGGGQLMRVTNRTYYVGLNDNNVPSLYVIENGQPPTIGNYLVEGIEAMEVEYGYDSDNNQAVDSYLTAAEVDDEPDKWARVRSARISLLVRSADENATEIAREIDFNEGTFGGDRSLRLLVDSTIAIRNRVP
jgi:type IV pilus assembly protein PilW